MIGRVFTLRGNRDIALVIRAQYSDGNARGTVTVKRVGVIGTMKVKVQHITRLWEPV